MSAFVSTYPTARKRHACNLCNEGLPRDRLVHLFGAQLPRGAHLEGGDRLEAGPVGKLLSLPEQPTPDPVLVDLIGPEHALKIAKAGLVCEPRARQ